MTKNQQISALLIELGKISGLSVSRNQASERNDKEYLMVEYSSAYGGYRLVTVSVDGGGQSGAFYRSGCEGRVNFATFTLYLSSLIAGIRFAKETILPNVLSNLNIPLD